MGSAVSSIGRIFGGGGGSSPGVRNPISAAYMDNANQSTQNALQMNADFVKALQGQNGIQNQSNVFNQLQGVASGQGPNPAMAMLNQATGKNVASQAALMAGQRGSSANPALMARQIANQGAATQQDAIGQGAVLQANQSLGALNQMGGMAGQMVAQQGNAIANQNQFAQGQQGNLLNSIAGQNNANASIKQQEMAGDANMMGNLMGAAGTAMLLSDKQAKTNIHDGAHPADKFMDSINMANGGNVEIPGMTQTVDIASAGGNWGSDLAKGIMAPGKPSQPKPIAMAGGPMDTEGMPNASKPMSPGANTALDINELFMAACGGAVPQSSQDGKPVSAAGRMYAEGGKVPALVSPGEKYLKPKDVAKVAAGANPMSVGETIPGKPKVAGAKDSYKNDTVPKTLQSGGIVLPRSVTKSANPEASASKFVAAIMAKKRRMPRGK